MPAADALKCETLTLKLPVRVPPRRLTIVEYAGQFQRRLGLVARRASPSPRWGHAWLPPLIRVHGFRPRRRGQTDAGRVTTETIL